MRARTASCTVGLLLPLVSLSAGAFDVWGFRNGMRQEQVEALARQQGYDTRVAGPNSTPRFENVAYSRKTPGGTFEIGYVAGFCDGHLAWLSRDYKGNMATLFDLLQDLKSTYGVPTTESSSSIMPEGRARSLTFGFKHKALDDAAELVVSLALDSDTAFSIQVVHKISESSCQ